MYRVILCVMNNYDIVILFTAFMNFINKSEDSMFASNFVQWNRRKNFEIISFLFLKYNTAILSDFFALTSKLWIQCYVTKIRAENIGRAFAPWIVYLYKSKKKILKKKMLDHFFLNIFSLYRFLSNLLALSKIFEKWEHLRMIKRYYHNLILQ